MADHVDRIGQQIGDYRLLGWLGGGGFGDVYLGEHLRERTQVAVKVLQTRLTRHEDLKGFINEARTMRLKHPFIIPLLDFGIASDDTPFLVMAYAPHGTLRDRHPKGSRLPLSTIASYVHPLASALQYAHHQHLIHRDVKPENMLVGANQEILLSDFGIVTVEHSSRSLAIGPGIGGTLPYMSPEQIAGKPRTASDQYALGIVVYEWLVGRRPFTGTAVEIALQHSMTSPPSLREQLPNLPVGVEQVVLIALAKDPKSRFADIEAFARAFEQATQQVDKPNSLVERFSPILPAFPVQDFVSDRPLAEQISILDPTVTNTTFASTPSISFSAMEGGTSGVQSINESVIPPSVSASSGSRSALVPPSSRYKVKKGVILLFVLLLLVWGSVVGLQWYYTSTNTSTAEISATATAVAHETAVAPARISATATASARAKATATASARAKATATASAQAIP